MKWILFALVFALFGSTVVFAADPRPPQSTIPVVAVPQCTIPVVCDCGCVTGKDCKCKDCPSCDKVFALACGCGCLQGRDCVCESCPAGKKPKSIYSEMYSKAIAENKNLIVFVGQPSQQIEGCLVCSESSFEGVSGKGVVVGIFRSPQLYRLADLSGTPSIEQILEVVSKHTAPSVVQYTAYYPTYRSVGFSRFRSVGCVGGG